MAGQRFFRSTSNLISNYCTLLTKRPPPFNQSRGIKHKVVDKLKELRVPEKPKRPLTPYFKFLQEHRDEMAKRHPDWRVSQVAAQCAHEWKAVDPSTKHRYENEFKIEMEQYAAKCLKYANSLTNEQKSALEEYNRELKQSKMKRERRKKERDNEKPKKPPGAYMLFVMEQAKEYPSKSYMELIKDLKNTWAALTAGEKNKYVAASTKAREQYQKDLHQWEIRMINEGKLDIVRQSTLTNKHSK